MFFYNWFHANYLPKLLIIRDQALAGTILNQVPMAHTPLPRFFFQHLFAPFVPWKVAGIGSSHDADEPTKHEFVLQTFSEIGYKVRAKKVCSSQCGIPMTRTRFHYQGILRSEVSNPVEQMDMLLQAWNTIQDTKFTAYRIHLEGAFGEYVEPAVSALMFPAPPRSDCSDERDKKGRQQHQEIFEQYRASSWHEHTVFFIPVLPML